MLPETKLHPAALVLALDVGTTGVTALIVDEDGALRARGYCEFTQHFPRPGWVEHDPEQIWQATLTSASAALSQVPEAAVTCVGVTVQRETVVLWDRATGRHVVKAIVWQDRRSADICRELIDDGHQAMVAQRTGLRIDPYFSASKLTWLARHEPHLWSRVTAGEVAIGTVDSYMAMRLSGNRCHITDASNASRTLLCNTETGAWDPDLAELFGVPMDALPTITSTWGELTRTDPTAFLGLDVPVTALVGDQQAALFGQACLSPGEAKCTYGTGAFVLINTGSQRRESVVDHPSGALLSTIAWQDPSGAITYAREGAMFISGAAVQWLRDGLGLITASADVEPLARQSGTSSAGVYFVPALAGLGAPFWDPEVRGMLAGLTRGSTAANIARAVLDACVYQVRAALDGAVDDPLVRLRVDGGACVNSDMMQRQADLLGVDVERPVIVESTGMGAAFLAGMGAGIWENFDAVRRTWRRERVFHPQSDACLDRDYHSWLRAVAAAQHFSSSTGV